MDQDQPHKIQFTYTWTTDFLTREGKGHTMVGDWLRDKTISWKVRSVKSSQQILTDGWVINRKMKKILLLEFEWTNDSGESYFQDMWKIVEK